MCKPIWFLAKQEDAFFFSIWLYNTKVMPIFVLGMVKRGQSLSSLFYIVTDFCHSLKVYA